MKRIQFARRGFGGPNEDVEKLLQKTGGAIFLRKIRESESYDAEKEGEKLCRVLCALFPQPTLDALAKKLTEGLQNQEKTKAPPPKTGKILNI